MLDLFANLVPNMLMLILGVAAGAFAYFILLIAYGTIYKKAYEFFISITHKNLNPNYMDTIKFHVLILGFLGLLVLFFAYAPLTYLFWTFFVGLGIGLLGFFRFISIW